MPSLAQNEGIARQSETTAELTQVFVDAEAEARQELLTLQRELVVADAQSRGDLQAMHAEIVQRDADGREQLDELHRQAHASIAARTQTAERRQTAAERMRAPIVAEAVKFIGGLIVCSLPLVVVIYLLRSLHSVDDTDHAMIEVLVAELVAERPRLLTPPGASPALPRPSADGDHAQ